MIKRVVVEQSLHQVFPRILIQPSRIDVPEVRDQPVGYLKYISMYRRRGEPAVANHVERKSAHDTTVPVGPLRERLQQWHVDLVPLHRPSQLTLPERILVLSLVFAILRSGRSLFFAVHFVLRGLSGFERKFADLFFYDSLESFQIQGVGAVQSSSLPEH